MVKKVVFGERASSTQGVRALRVLFAVPHLFANGVVFYMRTRAGLRVGLGA